jgi:WD40 repeat protein
MLNLVCSQCSKPITVNGRVPRQCPSCGATLPVAADTTRTAVSADPAAVTVVQETPSDRETIGRYVIICELGRGGFGTVYRARDPQLDRDVAIKVPHLRSIKRRDHAERFAREARTLAQLRHPGIVPIHTAEQEGDLVFLVSEFVEGEPLDQYLKSKSPLSFRTTASLLAALASAADSAHSKGIIHRDIKPSNVMIDAAGNPRLMDFGLAKREIDITITHNLQVLGTPAYMSPEQACGQQQRVDRRSDVYSLGVVLYQLLTGVLPFRGDFEEVRRKILTTEPARPRSLNKQIPVDLETICQKAMDKDAAKRYPTAGELAADLERWLRGEPILARHIGRPERVWRWAKRNPAPAGLIGSVALLLIILTLGSAAVAAVQAAARREAVRAKTAIEVALEKNQELLSRAYVERGERYVRVAESSDDYDPMRALPWLNEAMKLDEKNPKRLLADRIRIQTQLDLAPRVERMWFVKGGVAVSGLSSKRDMFFTTGTDGEVHIWRVAKEGAPIASLIHPGRVGAAAFSPDGSLLATGSVDGLRIWRIESGKLIKGPLATAAMRSMNRTSPDRNDNTNLLTFSKSGRLILTATLSGIAQVWDAGTGEPVGAPISTRQNVVTGDFADADRRLVLYCADRSIRLFDAQTGVEKHVLRGSGQNYMFATLNPNRLTIAAATDAGAIVFWNAATAAKEKQAFSVDARTMMSAPAFSPDGQRLAVGSDDGSIRTWRISDGKLLWKRQVSSRGSANLQFSADGSLLRLIRFNKGFHILNATTGVDVAERVSSHARLSLVDWTNLDGQLLAVDADGIIRLWRMESQIPAFMLPHSAGPLKAATSANRGVIATAEGERGVGVLRLAKDGHIDANAATTFSIGDTSIEAIVLNHDGSRLAISGERQVTIWDTASRERLVGPLIHSDGVKQMRFTPNGMLLVCVSNDGRAVVWDTVTGKRLYEPINVGKYVTDLDIDHEGTYCAVAAMKGVTTWALSGGEVRQPRVWGENFPRFCRFLDRRSKLLIAWQNRPIEFWDVEQGQRLHGVAKRSDLQCITLSDNHAEFLTGYADGTARLRSSLNGEPTSPPFESLAEVRAADIDPLGRWIATVSGISRVLVWDRETAELLCVCALEHLGSRYPAPQGEAMRQSIALLFFAPEARFLHAVTEQGLVISFRLAADDRVPEQIAADVSVRYGADFDNAGGLKVLEPEDLAVRWKTMNQFMPTLRSSASLHADARQTISAVDVP